MARETHPRRLWRRGTLSAGALAAAVALAACSGGGSNGTGSPAATTLTWGSYWGFSTFDPTAPDANAATSLFLQPVFDSLIRSTSSGDLVPMLATSWKYDDARTTLTMDLHKGVTFTDGEAFNADAVVANIDRSRKVQGPAGADFALVTSVTAVDSDTVQFKLAQPDPGLLTNLAGLDGMMLAPNSLTSASVATDPVGTGPYIYDKAHSVAGDTFTFTKNPHYWDKSLQKFQKVVDKVLNDPVARLNAIKSGQVNATIINPPQVQDAKASSLNVVKRETTWRGIFFYDSAGALTPALGDVRVRQAIAYAIDRKGLLDATTGAGYGAVTTQMFSPGTPAYVKSLDAYYSYDPAKAKKLLAEAGYANGLTLDLPDTGVLIGDATTAAVKQQLAEVGIAVDYVDRTLPIQDVFTRTVERAYSATLGEGGLGTGWSTVKTYLLPSAVLNPFATSTPESERLIEKITTTTGADQDAAYQQLNRYVVEQAWVVPFFRSDQVLVTDSAITVKPNPLGGPAPGLFDFAPAG